jgi:hypothetical protein
VFRNFYAHRNIDTFQKAQNAARQMGVSGRGTPSQLLAKVISGSSQPILREWLDDIKDMMDLLCN